MLIFDMFGEKVDFSSKFPFLTEIFTNLKKYCNFQYFANPFPKFGGLNFLEFREKNMVSKIDVFVFKIFESCIICYFWFNFFVGKLQKKPQIGEKSN